AYIKIYDPKGRARGERELEHLRGSFIFCQDEYDTAMEADALVIITEWNQFRSLDLDRIRSGMKDNFFFDLRNIYERQYVEGKGFRYYCVGR
ncbi:MAG TPA: UDP-glucose/GDP-mannose dehydrogenase family protein, partial [Negativicutes bacterium]|nr:UDP-glucose/GDP-mannose dehydrogenase family protein [Negativicutes bacterium]